MINMLVTGGCGFIGSNFIEYMLKKYDDIKLTNIDNMQHHDTIYNHNYLKGRFKRYHHVFGSINDQLLIDKLVKNSDYIVHFAAETHVDASLIVPENFLDTNINGTLTILEAMRRMWSDRCSGERKFIYVSTDEVYGSLALDDDTKFTEESKLDPLNPYSISKLAAERMAYVYKKTYGLPIMITRCSNNYGIRQFSDKFIPKVILGCKHLTEIPIYGTGLNVRNWLHVKDHCRALDMILRSNFDQYDDSVFNIGSDLILDNNTLVDIIINLIRQRYDINGVTLTNLVRHIEDRPGHDLKYHLSYDRIKKVLGWSPMYIDFNVNMIEIINWYYTR